MIGNLRLIGLLVVWTIASSVPALAWNDLGHMTAAYVAYQQLSTKTKRPRPPWSRRSDRYAPRLLYTKVWC